MNKYTLIATAFTVLELVACGGGGGGSTPVASNISLTGVGSKGLLSSADVQVYEVISDGSLKAIGSKTTTDLNGAYSIADLPVTTNPVIVKLTTTGSTEMLDETQSLVNGKFVKSTSPIKIGTEIRSMLTSLSATSELQITPFSEMAVAAAASTGKLTTESMASASSLITDSLGFDPFKTKPVNADATGLTTSQSKLMFLLTAVAIDTKTVCTGDSSGVSCAIERLNTSAAIEKDNNGNYKVKNAGSVTGKLNALKNSVANYSTTSSTFITAAKSTGSSYSVPVEPTPINPLTAVQASSLDTFLSAIRDGFNAAQQVMTSRVDSAKARIDALVFDSSSDGVNTLTSAMSYCQMNSNVYTCTGNQFTRTSAGNYNFEYLSTDSAYKFTGTIGASLSTAGDLAIAMSSNKTKVNGLKKVQEINLVASGAGLTTGATSGSIKFDSLVVKQYDISTSVVKYAAVDLSGLSLAINSTTNKANLTAPVSIATSEGDSFSGRINSLEVTRIDNLTTETVFANKLDLSIDVKAKEGNILSISIAANRDVTNFKPWLDKSANNIPTETASIGFTFADSNTITLSEVQNSFSSRSMSAKVKTGSTWLQLDAIMNIDSNDHQTFNSDGISITSSGVYNAKINKDTNGNMQGKLYQGTQQIGVITDGIIYVGTDKATGKQISLK